MIEGCGNSTWSCYLVLKIPAAWHPWGVHQLGAVAAAWVSSGAMQPGPERRHLATSAAARKLLPAWWLQGPGG